MRDTDEIRRRDDGAGPEIEHGVVRRVWMLPDGGIDVFLLCELGDIHPRPSRQQMLFVRSEGVVGRQVADKRAPDTRGLHDAAVIALTVPAKRTLHGPPI